MVGRRLRQPVHLVLDWDGTLTAKDTLSVIGNFPQCRDTRLERKYEPSITWLQLSKAYINDYRGHKESHFPQGEHVSDQNYRQWLSSLKPVEMRSALRAQSSGFFHGVTAEDVRTAAKAGIESGDVQLRPGWAELLELFLVDRSSPEEPNASARVSIISVNWSETFIRWSMWYALQQLDHPRKDDLVQLINDMEIYANEIHGLNSPQGSSGRLILKTANSIQTSAEKAKYMPPTAIRRSSEDVSSKPAASSPARPRLPFVIYVGDSAGDYECLKAADVGIWLADIAESERLQRCRETFAPLQVNNVPSIKSGESANGDIHWASSLAAIYDYLAVP